MNEDLVEQFHLLNLQLAVLRAEVKAVRQCLLRTTAPTPHLDGATPNEWIVRVKNEHLQQQLIELEDSNPALAAKLQALLDQQ